MKVILFCIFLNIVLSLHLPAQQIISNTQSITEDFYENTAQEAEETGQTEMQNELQELISSPLDINSGNLEILKRYHLLTEQNLQALSSYIEQYGPLVEMEELQQVTGFTKIVIKKILPYCTVVSQPTVPVQHQVIIRLQKSNTDISENYVGSPYKGLIRYKGILSKSFSVGFTGEKDHGEKLFSGKLPFDFNSFHLIYSGKRIIKKIVIGDYNVEYGQGLGVWTGFGIGNMSSVSGIFKSGRGIIAHSGTDENRFFRGIATSLKLRKVEVDMWFSKHQQDANIIFDSINEETYATSLQTSGYHRTKEEIQDKHSLLETAGGLSIKKVSERFILGSTFYYSFFDLPIRKSNQTYSKYKMDGNEYSIGSIYYSFSRKNIFLFGETAINNGHSLTHLHGIIISLDPRVSIGILFRKYSKKFIDLKSNAYGANSENTNENGKYVGINYKIIKGLEYSCYLDVYSFPFLKYRVDQPSTGYDFFNRIEFTPSKKFNLQIQYRQKLKQQNKYFPESEKNNIANYRIHSLRFNFRYKMEGGWEYGFRIEHAINSEYAESVNYSTMINQDIYYHPMGKTYSISARYSVFYCPDFDSRIYAYESDMQGSFSVPFNYGIGSKFYININKKLSRTFSLAMRYAVIWFDDSEETSPDKKEIKIQLKKVW